MKPNPKRPCGHTKIVRDCTACADRLIEALCWCMAHPQPLKTGPHPVGRIMLDQIERFEASL